MTFAGAQGLHPRTPATTRWVVSQPLHSWTQEGLTVTHGTEHTRAGGQALLPPPPHYTRTPEAWTPPTHANEVLARAAAWVLDMRGIPSIGIAPAKNMDAILYAAHGIPGQAANRYAQAAIDQYQAEHGVRPNVHESQPPQLRARLLLAARVKPSPLPQRAAWALMHHQFSRGAATAAVVEHVLTPTSVRKAGEK